MLYKSKAFIVLFGLILTVDQSSAQSLAQSVTGLRARRTPRLTGIPRLHLQTRAATPRSATRSQTAQQTDGGSYPIPDPEWGGGEGGGGNGGGGNGGGGLPPDERARAPRDRAQLMYPQVWDLRAGYAGSGAFGLGHSPDSFVHGGEIAFRMMIDQVTTQWANARVQVAPGEAGLNYLAIDASIFRIRLPLESTEALWLGVAPLEIDTRITTDRATRSRFGWGPRVMIGGIFRAGGTPHDVTQPCDGRTGTDANRGVCDPRRRGTAGGGCVIQLFASVGAMIGYQQTLQQGEVGQFLTGAEFLTACTNIVIDLSNMHLFSLERADVDRVDADIFLRFPIGQFDVGPYVTTQFSHEFGSRTAPPEDPARGNRAFVDISSGLRLWW